MASDDGKRHLEVPMANLLMIALLFLALGSILLASLRGPKPSLVPVRIRRRR